MSTFKMDLPETFSGEEGKDFHQWIKRFELAIEFIPGADEQQHILLPARLSGSAFTIWDGLPEAEKKDFGKIKDKLSQVFGRTQYLQTFRSCITARKRLPNEPLEVYASAIITMVAEAFPKYDAEAKDGEAFRRFIAGIDEKLRIKIHELGGTTLPDALDIALRIERAREQPSPTTSATVASTELTNTQDTVYAQILKRLDVLERKFDKLNLMEDRSATGDRQPRPSTNYFNPRDNCPSPPSRFLSPNSRSRYSQHYEKKQSGRQSTRQYESPGPSRRHPSKDDYSPSDYHRRPSPNVRDSPNLHDQRPRSTSPRWERRYTSPSLQRANSYQDQGRGYNHNQDRQSRGYRDTSDTHDNRRYSPMRSDRPAQSYGRPRRHVQFTEARSENFY